MIVDEILDRRDGSSFNPDRFREYVLEECRIFNFDIPFSSAFNEKDEKNKEDLVKRCLILYIIENNYNINIISFVLAVKWT